VIILGISPDPVESHKAFKEKYDLPFTLLADTERQALEAYDVIGLKRIFGKMVQSVLRTTYIIDGDGMILEVFENVNADGHSKEVLAFLAKSQF
jgi:peroxiredoxin Q/BCP